ncbi:MAG: hypothetical protein EBU80_11145 [Chitinophagia bacterium]|nr:hypothetical protein [Chitinophagia bacterium]
MLHFYSVLIINLIMMFLSISLIRTLYSNALIEKSTKNSLTILSILIPIGGLITVVLKHRRVLNHLVRMKELK